MIFVDFIIFLKIYNLVVIYYVDLFVNCFSQVQVMMVGKILEEVCVELLVEGYFEMDVE